jgi:ketosteroid isomerase-like protein
MMTDEQAIRGVVHAIHDSWRAGRYDEIGRHLADDAVIAQPGSDHRTRGRDPYVQSYRDYDRMATTHEFSLGEPQIDVVGDVAVAACPFFIVYELQGATYRERGTDMLVLSRSNEEWRVAWRTMQTAPSA